jgi:hypothetical protein
MHKDEICHFLILAYDSKETFDRKIGSRMGSEFQQKSGSIT